MTFFGVTTLRAGSSCHLADGAQRPSPFRGCRYRVAGPMGHGCPRWYFRHVAAASVGNSFLRGTGRRAICAVRLRGQSPNRPAFVSVTRSIDFVCRARPSGRRRASIVVGPLPFIQSRAPLGAGHGTACATLRASAAKLESVRSGVEKSLHHLAHYGRSTKPTFSENTSKNLPVSGPK